MHKKIFPTSIKLQVISLNPATESLLKVTQADLLEISINDSSYQLHTEQGQLSLKTGDVIQLQDFYLGVTVESSSPTRSETLPLVEDIWSFGATQFKQPNPVVNIPQTASPQQQEPLFSEAAQADRIEPAQKSYLEQSPLDQLETYLELDS